MPVKAVDGDMQLTGPDGVVTHHREMKDLMEQGSKYPVGRYKYTRPDGYVEVYENEVVEPDPVDPEEPPVDPDPEIPPVDPSDKPADFTVEVDRKNYVVAQDFYGQGYVRQQEYIEWSIGGKNQISFWNLDKNHAQQPFPDDKEFRLLVDGKVIATVTLTKASKKLTFTVSDEELLNHEFDIFPTVEGYSTFPVAVFVYHGNPDRPYMPAITSSHEFSLMAAGKFTYEKAQVVWVPTVFDPPEDPLEPKEFAPYRGSARQPGFVSDMIVVDQGPTSRRPNVTDKGVMTTFDLQGYHYHDLVKHPSRSAFIEGPRNIASIKGITSVTIGAGRKNTPDSPLVGNLYGTTTTSFFKVKPDGTTLVLAGDVMSAPAMQWQSGQRPVQVGDFSGMPEIAPQYFNELWKFIWNEKSTQVDVNAPWIADDDGTLRPPHPQEVYGYLVDSRHGRVVKAVMPTNHGGVVRLTEFITGLNDPFGGVYWRGHLIIAERLSNRICMYDAETGAFEKVICSGASGLASIQNDTTRMIVRHKSLEIIRAEDCVMPESVEIVTDEFGVESGEMVFSSQAMAQIKRYNLLTEEWGISTNIQATHNVGIHFSSLCLSDGTFGPLGTALVGLYQADRMDAYLPDGTPWDYGYGPQVMYNICGWIKGGWFVYAGAGEGIYRMRLPAANEPKFNKTKVKNGRQKWIDRADDLMWGPDGFAFHKIPLPWGEDAEIDEFLRSRGHAA